MVSISSELLQSWIIGLLWPLTRVLGMIAAAPIFNHNAMPVLVKLGLGVVLTLIIMPTLPPLPQFDIFSLQSLLILSYQLVIGLAIGFSMRLVFSAVEMAGQLIGMTMGFGFASFYDPNTQGQSTALNQFLVLMTMLIFLSVDGHLVIISIVADSFISMPIVAIGGGINPLLIAQWGGAVFSSGLMLAMPALAALLMTNIALAILTRTAPQLNLFVIGFPITLSMGLFVVGLALPQMMRPIENMLDRGNDNMRQITTLEKALPAIPAAKTTNQIVVPTIAN
jgi:flagellar biosynthetic protein FliR